MKMKKNEIGEGLFDHFRTAKKNPVTGNPTKKVKPTYIASFKTSEKGREVENTTTHDDYPSAVKAAGGTGTVTHNWPGEKSHGKLLYNAGKHLRIKEDLERKIVKSFKGTAHLKKLSPEEKKYHNKYVYTQPYQSLDKERRKVIPANEALEIILEEFLNEVHPKALVKNPESRSNLATYFKDVRNSHKGDSKGRSSEYLFTMSSLADDPSDKESMGALMHIKNAWNKENKRGSNIHIDSQPSLKLARPKVITKSNIKKPKVYQESEIIEWKQTHAYKDTHKGHVAKWVHHGKMEISPEKDRIKYTAKGNHKLQSTIDRATKAEKELNPEKTKFTGRDLFPNDYAYREPGDFKLEPGEKGFLSSMGIKESKLNKILDEFLGEDTTTGDIGTLPLGFKPVGMLAKGKSETTNPGGVYATKMEKKKRKYHNLAKIVASMGGV